MPTIVTSLTAWKEAIHFVKRLPVPGALVLQQSCKLSHRGVVERTSEAVVFNHASYVQVFDAYHIEPTYDIGGDLLHVVHSSVRDLCVNACDFNPLTLAAMTSFLAPGENVLGLGEFSKFLLKQARVDDVFTVGKSSKSIDTEIDTDIRSGFRQRTNRFIKNQRNKVPPITALGYRRSGGGIHEGSRPVNIESAEFGNGQVAVFEIVLKGAQRVFRSLWAVLFLKGRITCTLVEEVAERGLEMSKRLLSWDARDFVEPRSLGLLFQLCERGRRRVVVYVFTRVVCVSTSPKRPVVNKAAGPKSTRQYPLLRWGGVKPKSVTYLHNSEYTRVIVREQEERKGSAIPPPPKDDGLLALAL